METTERELDDVVISASRLLRVVNNAKRQDSERPTVKKRISHAAYCNYAIWSRLPGVRGYQNRVPFVAVEGVSVSSRSDGFSYVYGRIAWEC